jgi:plasmid stabilization system protein ParE
MKRQVLWSRGALDDLKQIADYIAEQNPLAGLRIGAMIRSAGDSLGEIPTGRRGRVAGTYEKVVQGIPYIIAYRLEPLPEDGEAVVILRAIHGARDWPADAWPE